MLLVCFSKPDIPKIPSQLRWRVPIRQSHSCDAPGMAIIALSRRLMMMNDFRLRLVINLRL